MSSCFGRTGTLSTIFGLLIVCPPLIYGTGEVHAVSAVVHGHVAEARANVAVVERTGAVKRQYEPTKNTT